MDTCITMYISLMLSTAIICGKTLSTNYTLKRFGSISRSHNYMRKWVVQWEWSFSLLFRFICISQFHAHKWPERGKSPTSSYNGHTKFPLSHVPESKILGRVFGFWEVFWILGSVLVSGKCFGFWDMFLDSGKCFGFWEVFCPYEPR